MYFYTRNASPKSKAGQNNIYNTVADNQIGTATKKMKLNLQEFEHEQLYSY